MSAVQQYIDLYKSQREMINRYSSPVLNARRDEAMVRLESDGLPSLKDEEHRRTDVEAIYAPDYGLNLTQIEVDTNPAEVFHCDVPNMSTLLYFVVNDSFHKAVQPAASKLPDGVLAGSLREMADRYPQLVAPYYGEIADIKRDGTVALNTAFAQDGFFLYIPDGVVMEKPIQLVNIFRGTVDFMVNRRILVVVGKGAQAKLLVCDHSDDSEVKFLNTQVCEIFVDDDAIFDYYDMEEASENTARVASTFVRQGARSNVLVNGIVLHNGITRNNIYTSFTGEHAELSLCGMAIADKEQSVDIYTHIDHAASHCHSNELFKYVLNDSARGAFSGRILVRHGAQKTEAYQSNKNLCASPTAKMYTKPQLEIYADDVKCSHGATVGQLDTNALFYMRARGIPEAEARMLLMFAFTNDVIEQVRLEALKDRLRLLVEKRFRGELAKCAGCRACR